MASGRATDTVSMVGSVSLAEQQQQQQQQQQQMTKAAPSLVCVECGRPVALLFREYNKGNIRLGRCSYCRSVADKYIECEFVLIAIDLALHRVQAYRHLLFNMRPFSTHSFHGRLWQLGVAMAALDAHLRHTALSSEAAAAALEISGNISAADGGSGARDPFWEAGGLLLAAVIEHACFAAGAVLCATSRVRSAAAAAAGEAKARRSRSRHSGGRRTRQRTQDGSQAAEGGSDYGGGGVVVGGNGGDGSTADREGSEDEWRSSPDVGRDRGARGGGQRLGRQQRRGANNEAHNAAKGEDDEEEEEEEEDDDGYESSSSYSLPPLRSDTSAALGSSPSFAVAAASPGGGIGGGGGGGVPCATKMYMAVVYPLFFRLLAAFVMIWDRQVAILNTIELLVATMQFVALSAVVGGPAAVSGMGEGGVASLAVLTGLASKMGARAVLCLWFGSDPRTLRML